MWVKKTLGCGSDSGASSCFSERPCVFGTMEDLSARRIQRLQTYGQHQMVGWDLAL